MQNKLMKFDPAFGTERPYPSHAQQWREYHGQMAWLVNPWTGGKRHPSDVGSDPFGFCMRAPGEQLVAADCQQSGDLTGVEARVSDLYGMLGVRGHAGAAKEIAVLRQSCGLEGR